MKLVVNAIWENNKMRNILILWNKYKAYLFMIVMICWFSLFIYAEWGIRNAKFGYELDNDKKEAIMMKQLSYMVWPYELSKQSVFKTRRGPSSKIYVVFEFRQNEDENIKKLYNTVSKNSKKLGFNRGCREKESIFVYHSNDFIPDPTVNELPPKQYTVEWEYPNPICVQQSKN